MQTMKAYLIREFGPPGVLQLEDVPVPEPAPGEALIKHDMIGVNFAETLMRRGLYHRGGPFKFPSKLGLEAAGRVTKLGKDVSLPDIREGSRVAAVYRKPGAYAQYGTLPADQLVPLPDDLPLEVAAAFPVQGMTAYYMLHKMHRTQPGETVLIHAVAGGVGLLATQMAKRLGARVIGTTSSMEKAQLARKFGADEIINYAEQDWVREARRLTDGAGVNLILDSVGQATFDGGLKALADFGHLILFGSASGIVEHTAPQSLMRGSHTVSGFWLHSVRERPDLIRPTADAVLKLYAEGALEFIIDEVFPFADAAKAHEKLENRRSSGKLLLKL
ncbi:quinone oxidoreductase, partial [bacterium]|nr:quinone oxidoreductase [bacterium]